MVIVGRFVLFALFNAISGNMTGVYPSEIYPSELRATGVDLASATSRVGDRPDGHLPVGTGDHEPVAYRVAENEGATTETGERQCMTAATGPPRLRMSEA